MLQVIFRNEYNAYPPFECIKGYLPSPLLPNSHNSILRFSEPPVTRSVVCECAVKRVL